MTNVATRANLPYDRLLAYLEELATAELVTRDRMPRLTDRGRDFLRQYRQWMEVLNRFGLER